MQPQGNGTNSGAANQDTFSIIQRIKEAIEDTSLTPSDVRVLIQLMLSAGPKGHWTQSNAVTAAKVGLGERSVKYIIGRLESRNLLKRNKRGHYRANQFLMPWHAEFDGDVQSIAPQEVQSVAPIKEVLPKDTHKTDIDCSTQASNSASGEKAEPKQYPILKETMRRYMVDYGTPSDDMVARVMIAAKKSHSPATERDVVALLLNLHNERGLRAYTETGPHSWKWFESTVYEQMWKFECMDYEANRTDYNFWWPRNAIRERNRQAPEGTQWNTSTGSYTPMRRKSTQVSLWGEPQSTGERAAYRGKPEDDEDGVPF